MIRFRNHSVSGIPMAEKVGAVITGGDFQALGVLRTLAKKDIPVIMLDSDFCIGKYSRFKKKFFIKYNVLFIGIKRQVADKCLNKILKKMGSKGKIRYIITLFSGDLNENGSIVYI